MNAFAWIVDPSFSTRLTMALLHFLWQGCCGGLLVFAGAALFKRGSAHGRYTLNTAVMFAMAACLPVNFIMLTMPTGIVGDNPVLQIDNNSQPPHSTLNESSVTSSIKDLPTTKHADIVPQSAVTADNTSLGFQIPIRSLSRWVAVLYLAGVALVLGRLLHGVWGGRHLRRVALPITDESLLNSVSQLARRVGLRVDPVIAWCEEISIPIVVGILHPMILLPAAFVSGLTPDQLDALILHELAHIRRFDPIVNLLQRIIEAVLFFHPVVWFVSRQISREREQAADDMVLSVGWNRAYYADALVRMAEISSTISRPRLGNSAAVLAATGTGPSEFKIRVLRLLDDPRSPKLHLPRAGILALLLLVGLGGVFAWSQPGHSETSSVPEDRVAGADSFSGNSALPARSEPEDKAVKNLPTAVVLNSKKEPEVNSFRIAPPRLRVTYADGSLPSIRQYVVEANIGFPEAPMEPWAGMPDDDGSLSLEGLTDGEHWLFANGRETKRTPLRVTLPSDQPRLERRLRTLTWGRSFENVVMGSQPVVEGDERNGEYIVVEIHNQSRERLSFSEEDICLLSRVGRQGIRGMSPKWLTADREPFPKTAIEAGQTGRLRLSWREWSQKGLWAYRNEVYPITEMGFPPSEPGKTWVKVVLKTERSLPVAVIDPAAMRHDAVNTTREPIPEDRAPPKIQIKNADGSRAQFNDMVSMNVGFPKSLSKTWVGWPDRDGIVTLERLPTGAHWLLAAGSLEQRTPVQVKLPAERPLMEQRLRIHRSWVANAIETKATVETDGIGSEILVVEIRNGTTEALDVSEADVQLQSEIDREPVRGLSPKWSTPGREQFSKTTINVGETGRLRLSWKEWARNGLWSSRNSEPISEPALPSVEPGKVSIRVCVGNNGSLPITVSAAPVN
jgi:beta-lactamase regulating signal transducer with metallopeptidase domain